MSMASTACAARGFSNTASPGRHAGRDRGAERPMGAFQLILRMERDRLRKSASLTTVARLSVSSGSNTNISAPSGNHMWMAPACEGF